MAGPGDPVCALARTIASAGDRVMPNLLSAMRRLLPEPLRLAIRARRAVRGGERELALVPALCDRDGIAVDVGANLGVYAVHLRRHSRGLVAIEPVPALAERLRRGLGPRATVLAVALSDREGEATLAIPRRGDADLPSRATLEPGANREFERRTLTVPLRTLDGLDLQDVAVLKVHTEGHEAAVLRGGRHTLARWRPVVLVGAEERHRRGNLAEIAALMGELGYAGHFVHDGALRPLSSFDPARHQDPCRSKPVGAAHPADYVHNFVFVHPDRARVLDRIAALLPGGQAVSTAVDPSPTPASIPPTSSR
jgi:FkbM family methyltransferase